ILKIFESVDATPVETDEFGASDELATTSRIPIKGWSAVS
ncbi:unnamed protein product, partial [marine sediment metagenome]